MLSFAQLRLMKEYDVVDRGRVRYSVDIAASLDSKMEQIAQAKGVKKSELLRSALVFYFACDELQNEGHHAGAWKKTDDGFEFVKIPL